MDETQERPLVTFALFAYNQEKYIREAIEGAFSQTYEPLEIIISDDSSTDRTYLVAKNVISEYPSRKKLTLRQTARNLGLIDHVNEILQLANGELIVVAAGDDISEPDRVEVLVDGWLQSSKNSKYLYSSYIRIDENGQELTDASRSAGASRPYTISTTMPIISAVENFFFAAGATAAWDRALFERFGPLTGHARIEDTSMAFRALMVGKVEKIEKPLVRYRLGGVSDSTKLRTPHDFIYTHRLMEIDWRIGTYAQLIIDANKIGPDGDNIIVCCQNELQILRETQKLIQSKYFFRFALLPKIIFLSLNLKNSRPIKEWTKYTFEAFYTIYFKRRLRKNAKLDVSQAQELNVCRSIWRKMVKAGFHRPQL